MGQEHLEYKQVLANLKYKVRTYIKKTKIGGREEGMKINNYLNIGVPIDII